MGVAGMERLMDGDGEGAAVEVSTSVTRKRRNRRYIAICNARGNSQDREQSAHFLLCCARFLDFACLCAREVGVP